MSGEIIVLTVLYQNRNLKVIKYKQKKCQKYDILNIQNKFNR